MYTKLRSLRRKANLTQQQSADALGIGQTTISMWENGESRPQSKMLPKIAELYKCRIEDLFDEK